MFQLPLPGLLPKTDWKPPVMGTLPSWKDAKRVVVDIETRDDHLLQLGPGVRRGGYMVGYSFAIEGGPSAYVPIRHDGGDNVDVAHGLEYIRDQARDFKGELLGANLTYDLDYLEEEGAAFRCKLWDVLIPPVLCWEHHMSYSLDNVLKRAGFPGKDEKLLKEAAAAYGVDPKGGMWKLPARYVGPYALGDAVPLLALREAQELDLQKQGLEPIFELERRVQPALLAMRRRGVAVDQDRMQRIEDWTYDQQKLCIQKVKHLTGADLAITDFTKASALAPVLEGLGIQLPRTPTGKPSVKNDFLLKLDHPVGAAINRARKLDRVRNTFVASMRRYMTKGRIHCSFNQLKKTKDDGDPAGTISGRLSAVDPNMQQQPGRDPEIGPIWRGIFRPDGDGQWACLDYSQQEPRWTVHYAEEAKVPGATKAGDEYRNDPSTDHHTMMAKLTGVDRKDAKAIFLGLCYGMGGGKLCRSLGLPTEFKTLDNGEVIEVAGPEGEELIGKFNNAVPFVKGLADQVKSRARRVGRIRTKLGRVLHFPKDEKGKFTWVYKALNRLIQGASADQTKAAVAAAHEAGFPLQLQVHDELDLTVSGREEASRLATLMREVVELNVPSKVDEELGDSWGEIDDKGRAKCEEFYAT